ncbi:MAG: hypothetical protein GTO30_18545, partial [Acidobacteria bacterium]|nr:hypothetical protein [Acidobacteriota bacterium]NIQ86288.1 hypothetical protein [Acidobacteriota bacterium]
EPARGGATPAQAVPRAAAGVAPARGPVATPDEPEVEHGFVADGVDYQLHPNWTLASRLSGGIVAVVLSGVNLIGLLIGVLASNWRGPGLLLAFAGWLLLSVALAVWTQVGPALRY